METKSFFGEQGLTSTSANFYANIAKEEARKLNQYLSDVRFYRTTMRLINEDKGSVVKEGVGILTFPTIYDALERLSSLYSLIAFFREAIKEKERLANEVKNWTDLDARTKWQTKKDALDNEEPVHESYLTEEDVKKTWSVGEQEKYLSLEAEASVYGKFVHEDGSLSKAREELMKIINNPIDVNENGRDTIIYEHKSTIASESVDDLFFNVQKKQREVQAELNGMKKRIEDAINEQKLAVDGEYNIALHEYNAKRNALQAELTEIAREEKRMRTQMSMDVQALKIVVPNRLKLVFDSLKEL